MLGGLLNYLNDRLRNFEKMQPISFSVETYFVEPLITIFEENIFKQQKSNFVQYITLFIIAHVGQGNLVYKGAQHACRQYMERILSYLIIRSFPISFEKQDFDNLNSRIQAMNYLTSLMVQKIAAIPDKTYLKCLNLILEY